MSSGMVPYGDYLPQARGVGGNPPMRPDQIAQQSRSRAGVGPAPTNVVFIGRLIVVFGTGASTGIFFYSGSPGPGNPPALAITTASSDPYGNPVTASAITDSGFPFLLYSGTPALGNLILSLSPFAGVDDVGNSYPEGLNVTAGTISGVSVSGTTITMDPGPYLLYGNPGQVVTYLTGSGSWTAPAGVTSVKAECWGGDAGGWSENAGPGGGGGEYAAEPALGVTPLSNYAYSQGGGGGANTAGGNTTFAGDTVTVTAHGGQAASTGHPAGGTGSTNTTHFNGGQGGTGYSLGGPGGGGGGSAGPTSAGNSGGNGTAGSGGAGAAAVPGGGKGGKGGNSGANGSSGAGTPGGGGGGAGGGGFTGGTGGSGQIRLTYTPSGVVQLLAALASSAGTDPNTGDAYPGPGLGLAAVGTPASLAGWAALFANANDELGFVSGSSGQAMDTGTVTRVTAGQAVTSTTPAPVTWGSGSNPLVAAGVEYHVHGEMVATMGAVTSAAVFQLTGPAVTAMRVKFYAIENVSILASNQVTTLAAMNSGAIPNGTAAQFFFDGIIEFAAAGSLGLEVAQGTAGDNWTLNSQSEMWVRPLAA
jgi:hypothetical protein